jgi:hypothetical protein
MQVEALKGVGGLVTKNLFLRVRLAMWQQQCGSSNAFQCLVGMSKVTRAG